MRQATWRVVRPGREAMPSGPRFGAAVSSRRRDAVGAGDDGFVSVPTWPWWRSMTVLVLMVLWDGFVPVVQPRRSSALATGAACPIASRTETYTATATAARAPQSSGWVRR